MIDWLSVLLGQIQISPRILCVLIMPIWTCVGYCNFTVLAISKTSQLVVIQSEKLHFKNLKCLHLNSQVDITMRQLVSHLAGIRHYSKDYIKKLKFTDHEHDGKNSSKDDQMKELTDNGKEKCNKKEKDSELKEFYVTKDYSSVVDALEMFKEDPLMHKPG